MAAVSEAMAVLDVVSSSAAPVTHLAVVLAPGMNGAIMNSDLSSMPSFAFEVGGLVHVAVDTATNAGDGVSGRETVRTPIHG